jgi:hypothetical protein
MIDNAFRIPKLCLLFVGCLAGCSGLTQMQDTVSKFDQGAHSVATGQMSYFRQVQIADCNNQFYSAAFNFSIRQTNDLDLTGKCIPTILDNTEIEIRQALMDSITLYVDKIQTLATNDSNKALDANSQNLATKLNGVAKSHGFTNLSAAAEIEAAVIAISEMALDQRKFNEISTAANTMNPPLIKIVNALKSENNKYAIGMASKMGQIQIQLKAAISDSRDKTNVRSFIDIISAREIIRAINPLGASPLAVAEGNADPKLDPQNVAKQLNASLDSLVNANNALANAGTGGAIAAVNDLIARAQQANNVLTSINK